MSEPANDMSLAPRPAHRVTIAPMAGVVEWASLVRRRQSKNCWLVVTPLRVILPGIKLRNLTGHGWQSHAAGYVDIDEGFEWNGVGGRAQWPLRDAPTLVLSSLVHDVLCTPVAVAVGVHRYPCSYLARHAVYRRIARAQGDPLPVAWAHWTVLVSVNWIWDRAT